MSQIIPIEKLSSFVNEYDTFLKIKCKRQQFVNKRDPISYFDNMALWDGGWFHLGFAELVQDNIVTNFSAYAYRLTDSFVQISFYFSISDTKRYLFYNLLRKYHDSTISLLTKKHPVMFRKQAMKFFGPSAIRRSELYSYFFTLRQDIFYLLNRSNLLFHISSLESISCVNILSFKKIHRFEENIRETFWNTFHLDSDFCFISNDQKIFFPEFLNFENDIGKLSNYFFINEENVELLSGFHDIEHQIRSELHDWGMDFIRSLLVNNVFDNYYQSISTFRMNYFNSKNNKRYLRKYDEFQSTNYWISLFSQEYRGTNKRSLMFYSPILIKNLFHRNINLSDLLNENNNLKIKSLNNLSGFINKSINNYFNNRIIKINLKTQAFIIFLTITTIIIGVIQISEIGIVKETYKNIFEYVQSVLNTIKKLLRV